MYDPTDAMPSHFALLKQEIAASYPDFEQRVIDDEERVRWDVVWEGRERGLGSEESHEEDVVSRSEIFI